MRRCTPGMGESTQGICAPCKTTRWVKSALSFMVWSQSRPDKKRPALHSFTPPSSARQAGGAFFDLLYLL
jgi:hypothetical protein